MANNQIILDSERINDIANQFGISYSDSVDAENQVIRDFSNVRSSGILTNTINTAESQMSSLSESYKNTQKTISELMNEFDFDKKMANYINSIKIPHGFVTNNTMEASYYDYTMLSKRDGISVNNRQGPEEINNINDSSISSKEELTNINNGEITIQEQKDSYDVQKEELANINNGETSIQEQKDSYDIQKEELANINNGESSIQEQEDNYDVQKEELANINNGETSIQEQEDNYDVQKEELTNINNGETSIQEQEDNYDVQKKELENISGAVANNNEYYDSSIIKNKTLNKNNNAQISSNKSIIDMNPNIIINKSQEINEKGDKNDIESES